MTEAKTLAVFSKPFIWRRIRRWNPKCELAHDADVQSSAFGLCQRDWLAL